MLNTIYILRNLINDKIYVGQTWLSFKDRWNNGRGYKRNPYLDAAIKKYGKSNFRYEILTFCGTQETADYWEFYFIEKSNSIDRTIGYNLREGGNGGGRLSEETRHKLSVINLGKVVSEEVKEKLRIAGIGNKNAFGHIASEKSKEAVSLSHKGKPKSEEQKKKMSAAATGRLHLEESKSKMRKPKSESAKNNMSLAKRKLTPEQDKAIKIDTRPIKIIAQDYNVSTTTIARARKR